jgi:hypothetical protein
MYNKTFQKKTGSFNLHLNTTFMSDDQRCFQLPRGLTKLRLEDNHSFSDLPCFQKDVAELPLMEQVPQ